MITESLTISRRAFEEGTGWLLKPEGACKGDVCIPLSDQPMVASSDSDSNNDLVDLVGIAEQMGLPLVADDKNGVWALGPDSVGSRTLVTAEAPELTLPDLDGNLFSLSSLRGQKVLMVAWSPY